MIQEQELSINSGYAALMGAVLFSAGQATHCPLHSHNNSIHNGQCNDQLKAIRIASATALKAKRQEEKLLGLS